MTIARICDTCGQASPAPHRSTAMDGPGLPDGWGRVSIMAGDRAFREELDHYRDVCSTICGEKAIRTMLMRAGVDNRFAPPAVDTVPHS